MNPVAAAIASSHQNDTDVRERIAITRSNVKADGRAACVRAHELQNIATQARLDDAAAPIARGPVPSSADQQPQA